MKTLGRILILLAVFLLVMGFVYVVVNANSSSTNAPAFTRGGEGFPQPAGMQSQFPNVERPEFPGGEGSEFGRGGRRGAGWIFGLVRNVGILAMFVALIAVPKRLMRSKRKTAVPITVGEQE